MNAAAKIVGVALAGVLLLLAYGYTLILRSDGGVDSHRFVLVHEGQWDPEAWDASAYTPVNRSAIEEGLPWLLTRMEEAKASGAAVLSEAEWQAAEAFLRDEAGLAWDFIRVDEDLFFFSQGSR